MKAKRKQAEELFNIEEILNEEEKILEAYQRHRGKTLRILLSFFKGHYKKLFASSFFFILKSSPTWIIPLIFSEIVDLAVQRPADAGKKFFIYAIIAVVSVLQNVPTHMLNIKYFSLAKRDVEAGLRGAMVRKLQQLSISFHKETAAGKIQSKVMRDVEAVEGMADQLFHTVLTVGTNLIISLGIVLFTNIYVFLMFLLCIPVAVLLRQVFSKHMRQSSQNFRRSVENTSAAGAGLPRACAGGSGGP